MSSQRIAKKLEEHNNELTENHINMKKVIEYINKGTEEMKKSSSELKNTVEGNKSRLDDAEDLINEMEDKEQKTTERVRTGKEAQKE